MRKLKRTVPVRARKENSKHFSLLYEKKWQGDFCSQGVQKINFSMVHITVTLKLFSADVLSAQKTSFECIQVYVIQIKILV